MNILITGICGFVGSNLVVNLKEQHSIYGLDIVSPPKDGVIKTYAWEELMQIPSIDVIIHLAGKAHDTKNTTDEKAYFDINVELTKKIFDFYLQSNALKFIFFSSVKAATDKVQGEYLTEEGIPNPQTPYGKSKLAAEEYVLCRKPETSSSQSSVPGIRTSEKKVFILRPCMIHGPGNKGNLNLLYQLVSKNIPWPLGAFENKRSFTSIDNLAFIINQLIEKNIEPGIYNMSDDIPISTNHLIEIISASTGKKVRIWRINEKLISIAARIGDIFHLLLNSERLKKLTESYVVSNQKLKEALGIEKMPISAENGMKKTLQSF
jgi:nucleoside-diphosphate-sugar epimerase